MNKLGFNLVSTVAIFSDAHKKLQTFKVFIKTAKQREVVQELRFNEKEIRSASQWATVFDEIFHLEEKDSIPWSIPKNAIKIRRLEIDLESGEPISFHGMFPSNQQDFEDMGETGVHPNDPEDFFQSPEQEKEAILKALQEKLDATVCKPKVRERLRKVILKHWKAFCDRDSQCSMSYFTPMKVEVDENKHF